MHERRRAFRWVNPDATPQYDESARALGWQPLDSAKWFREFQPGWLDPAPDYVCPVTGKAITIAGNSAQAVAHDMLPPIHIISA